MVRRHDDGDRGSSRKPAVPPAFRSPRADEPKPRPGEEPHEKPRFGAPGAKPDLAGAAEWRHGEIAPCDDGIAAPSAERAGAANGQDALCAYVRRLLDDDVEAVLTGARGPTVTRHLEACDACRGARAEQEKWWNRLRSAIPSTPGPSDDFVQSTMRRVRALFS